MPTTSDVLHDRVDAVEDLLDRARDTVERIMRAELDRALADSGQNVEAALALIAALVAAELDGLTTEAVRKGMAHARMLGRAS